MSFRRSNAKAAALLTSVLLAVLVTLGLSGRLQAFDQLSITLQHLGSEAWQAEQLHISLDWPTGGVTSYRLAIARLSIPALAQPLTDLSLMCDAGEVSDAQISCQRGRLRLPLPQLDKPVVDVSFALDQLTGRLSGRVDNLYLAGGLSAVEFSLLEGNWQARIRGKGLKLASLLKLLPAAQQLLPGWTYDGRMDPDIRVSGSEQRLNQITWQTGVAVLAFSDAAGMTVGEGLSGALKGSLKRRSGRWEIGSDFSLKGGELLTPYGYLDAVAHPVQVEAKLSADADFTKLRLLESHVAAKDLLSIGLQGEIDVAAEHPLQTLTLEMPPIKVADLYRELLLPVLFGTSWDHLELAGKLGLRLSMAGGEPMGLDLTLADLTVDDAKGGKTRRLGLYGMNGRIQWKRGEKPADSRLSWESGHLLEKIDLGTARIDFQLADKRFRLIRQAVLPVLDGSLVIDRLDLDQLGEADQKLEFDGIITPITMGTLSEALGWMPLSGKLSGMIPGLSYKNRQLQVEGVLLVRMFDGDILISGLKSRGLFGIYPQLSAEIEMKNLDLETLTRTFSFGRITGRLDGYVRGLALEAWHPVAFDARFYTPEGDKSRHRISQKAVDNISNLGGAGLSGSLARSFLGFFEEFRYKRIGIGCRLSRGNCEMVGVGETKQGYYLVEGGGIPRIDIIGYNKTADWDRLLQQLKQITESGAPVIQ